MTVSPGDPVVGEVVSYTVRVTNLGAVVANAVTLVHEAPAGASFVSAEASQGSCTGTIPLACSLGSIEPGGSSSGSGPGASYATSVTVVHRVRFGSAGDASSVVSLSGGNSVGGRQSTSVVVSAGPRQQPPPPPPLPPVGSVDDGVPNPNQTVVLEPVSGEVFVRLPGSDQFVPLTGLRELPNGTEVDAREGRIRLTVAAAGGSTQASEFFEGLFTVAQVAGASSHAGAQAAAPGVSELRLSRGDFSRCVAQPAKAKAKKKAKKRKPAGVEQAKPRQPVRRLWGDGSGSFRTRGRYSSATVRGTRWLTEDYCNGTLIRVEQGTVTVRDLVKKRTVVVTAGKSYFAQAPAPKPAKAKANKTKKRKPARR